MFAVQGTNTYPDATFTLRLAYGTVVGYTEAGNFIPPWTTIGGAFEHERRHGAKEPWILPESWRRSCQNLDLGTPHELRLHSRHHRRQFGQPRRQSRGETGRGDFDGNIQSLTANYFYSDEQARAVSVDIRAVLEALHKVYGAANLADELGQ